MAFYQHLSCSVAFTPHYLNILHCLLVSCFFFFFNLLPDKLPGKNSKNNKKYPSKNLHHFKHSRIHMWKNHGLSFLSCNDGVNISYVINEITNSFRVSKPTLLGVHNQTGINVLLPIFINDFKIN